MYIMIPWDERILRVLFFVAAKLFVLLFLTHMALYANSMDGFNTAKKKGGYSRAIHLDQP